MPAVADDRGIVGDEAWTAITRSSAARRSSIVACRVSAAGTAGGTLEEEPDGGTDIFLSRLERI